MTPKPPPLSLSRKPLWRAQPIAFWFWSQSKSAGGWALLAAWLCWGAMTRAEVRAEVRTGADHLLADEATSPLRGKRVGLITNPTGVTRDLDSLPLRLRQRKDLKLVALYGPEHGVRGNAQAGTRWVSSGIRCWGFRSSVSTARPSSPRAPC